MDQLQRYYTSPQILSRMAKYLKNRETVLIYSKATTTHTPNSILKRGFTIRTTNELRMLIEHYRVVQNKVNIYYSLGSYNPLFQSHAKEPYSHHCMTGYDLCIDIDQKYEASEQAVLVSAQLVQKVLKAKGYPFELRFTGRGFHFIVPYSVFGADISLNPDHPSNIYKWYKALAQELYDTCSELIDLNIYDSRRVVKLPYSLAFYPEGTFICTPINSLDKFNKENYKYENFFGQLQEWHE